MATFLRLRPIIMTLELLLRTHDGSSVVEVSSSVDFDPTAPGWRDQLSRLCGVHASAGADALVEQFAGPERALPACRTEATSDFAPLAASLPHL